MAYEVTATRKRPQLFDEIAGQDFVVSTLTNAIQTGRIAHAYLFAGPRGVGKTSAARILARALNCENGPTDHPCGECAACTEIARGNSLDVIEIDGASNTSVNDVREIKDEVLFAPNSSRYKVYIIDEVHMLSNSAFNALLKTIEEPPPYIVFVFATTEIHKVPATIRSRCQQFNFRLIPVEIIRDRLSAACSESGVDAEPEALFWIAREATGSLRDAYTLFDQVVSFSGKRITLDVIRDKLGLAGFDRMTELADACASGDAKRVLELSDEMLASGVSVEQLTIDLADYFRGLLFVRHGLRRESLIGYPPERFSERSLAAFTVSQLEQAINLLLGLYRDVRYSLNPRFELELALSRLAGLGAYLTPREILARLDSAKSELAGGRATAEAPNQSARARGAAGTAITRTASAAAAAANSAAAAKSAAAAESAAAATANSAGPQPAAQPNARAATGANTRPAAAAAIPQQPVSSLSERDDDDADLYDDIEEEIESQGPAPAPRTAAAPAKPNGVRAEVVAALRKTKLALSSALERAAEWELSGAELKIAFEDSFSANLVREDLAVVSEAVAKVTGDRVKIVVEARSAQKAQGASQRNEQIELVKKVFRGEVIQGGES